SRPTKFQDASARLHRRFWLRRRIYKPGSRTCYARKGRALSCALICARKSVRLPQPSIATLDAVRLVIPWRFNAVAEVLWQLSRDEPPVSASASTAEAIAAITCAHWRSVSRSQTVRFV